MKITINESSTITIDGSVDELIEFIKECVPMFNFTMKNKMTFKLGPVWFDENCAGWRKDTCTNHDFLKMQELYANEKLNHQGYLFLNDVYDMLGIAKTKDGNMLGWLKGSKIDFGLDSVVNTNHLKFNAGNLELTFNVDGYILDKI